MCSPRRPPLPHRYENCTSVCALTAAITGGATPTGGHTSHTSHTSHTGGHTSHTGGHTSHASEYERSMCEQRCRIHCPPSGAADVATWPAPVADNFWAANLEVRDCT